MDALGREKPPLAPWSPPWAIQQRAPAEAGSWRRAATWSGDGFQSGHEAGAAHAAQEGATGRRRCSRSADEVYCVRVVQQNLSAEYGESGVWVDRAPRHSG